MDGVNSGWQGIAERVRPKQFEAVQQGDDLPFL
jgi:hypothetical protein